ncbi:peptide deformylase [Paraperlucidibaca wandonensis]|jgi:peptide deformylase|uniref:Peptide deformylase n=1 Tax=Paraperlucidibaca wandonensis TaxID=1268273 RepID=A0ABW3HIX7_9GAMM|nr:peptide deformylase [Paraperlucidibaca sp.]MBQ0723590.1 peptide deformylase [Paraperlucidibaca sp.]MBQ0842885.1 peptide deformylase [Paraperlucidibaca sp.]|tara:strand:- start:3060 stop:3566 length:507 start_codon:yes stop_codon:yes gene_type:complete
MALLPILEFPDPRLRTVAKPVAEVTDEIRQLVKDMLETMYAAPGIGLAASQVDRHIRLLVLDISEDQSKPQVFINPTFEPISAETKAYDEGCLSIPGFYESVERPDLIRVSALDLQGQPQTTEADGLLSVCIQHEIDHLDGKLFVDYISTLKRNRIKAKLEKLHKSRD